MNSEERERLDGAIVLVTPGDASTENPPVGMRGTIRVVDETHVEITLAFAAQFYGRPRQKVIKLEGDELRRLLASEQTGNFSYEMPSEIQPPA